MAIPARPAPAAARRGFGARRWRDWAWQAAVILLIAAAVWWLASTTLENMRLRGIRSGFGFLAEPAGFDIGEGWLAHDAQRPYWHAFLVGLVNTLRAAIPAIVLCTALGTALGIGRFSRNALVRGLCHALVDLVRNVPLLLQLLTWYLLMTEYLPEAGEPWVWAGVVQLSKNGLAFGAEQDVLLTPEYLSIVIGLSVYTAAYVAEVVRSGIAAVPAGQLEAAAALGLSRGQVLRRIVLPQALRLIVPPLTNQYLNLTKNSSLGVAVGYPELVSVANTSLNQTGRAVECIAIVMAVYLVLSLLTASAMGRVNRRFALRER
jgi:general L-amino acid transport system permease protein